MTKTSKKKFSILRFVLKALILLFFILIVALIAAYYYLGSIVKEAVTRFVPPITGTSAVVEHVDLSLLKGNVEIRGLKIGNPKGYSENNIFELGKIKVVFQPKTVLSDKIIIDSIVISGTKVSAELKNLYSLDSNIGAIKKNVESYLGNHSNKATAPAADKSKSKSDSSPEKKVVVRDLLIEKSEVSVGAAGQTIGLLLPDIHQQGIGEGKQNKSIGDIIADILDSISIESVKAVAASAKDLAKQGVKQATDLVNTGTDAVKGSVNTAKDTVNNIKGLFK
ncbi:MAG: hypothetical protein IJV07_05820 [Alphaproteobacteria bacterium]|nr:hypothetical protein [Alphaproteobacteria bacterium]